MVNKSDADTSADNSNSVSQSSKSNVPPTAWWFIFGLAILILFGYVYFIIFMVNKTDLGEGKELQWSRLVFLFSGVEAIVFAAVGFVFGREVHRSKADAADTRAENAEQKNQEAQKKASEMEGKVKVIASIAKSKIERKQNAQPNYLGYVQPGSEAVELQTMIKAIDDLLPEN